MDAFLWNYHSLSCGAVLYTLYIVMSRSYRLKICSNNKGNTCNCPCWCCLENEPASLSICDVSCQLSPQVSSLVIVTNRSHPSDTLTVLMERKGIFVAHWLPHLFRRLGCKSLLLYFFRTTTSSLCFTVMHFDNTFWYCLKVAAKKNLFYLQEILNPKNYKTALTTHW